MWTDQVEVGRRYEYNIKIDIAQIHCEDVSRNKVSREGLSDDSIK